MTGLGKELIQGCRLLARNPGVSGAAIFALALGIGANSAIFSVVNAVLLMPLPYPDPDQVIVLRESRPKLGVEQTHVAPVEFMEWRRQSQSFSQMSALLYEHFSLTGVDEPERLAALRVAENFFPLLGMKPLIGRAFHPDEHHPGRDQVVMIGHSLWQRRFGADAGILGKTITVNGSPHTVVGILSPEFEFMSVDFDVYVPLSFKSEDDAALRVHRLEVLGRLRTGRSIEQARAEMEVIAGRLERENPAGSTGHRLYLAPLHAEIVSEVKPKLLVLFGAVGFVLLIACANIANLLLARASARSREMAVRTALGAGRGRIIRQLLTESVVLSGAGGLLGLALAAWGIRALAAFMPEDTPRLNLIGLSWSVVGFTLLVSFATGILFGLAPALRGSRSDVVQALREGGRGATPGARHHRLRSVLVVSEIALSLMLLAGAGLMIDTFRHLSTQNPGFRPAGILTMQMALTGPEFAGGEQHIAFYRQVLDRVRAMPGVESAATTTRLPLASYGIYTFSIEGAPITSGPPPVADVRCVSPKFFQVLGVPLLSGRELSDSDGESATPVAVINQKMARRYWPNQNPIGKRLIFGRVKSKGWITVVGVIGDIKVRSDPPDEIYVPFPQMPLGVLSLLIRTQGDPMLLARAVRDEVWRVNRNQPIHSIRTMEQVLKSAVAGERVTMVLLGSFAALAVIMAALGIYGVVSHSVTMRRHEIGLRMALGAQTSDVLRQIMKHALGLTLAGIAGGIAGAFTVRNVLAAVLYGVSATDPLILTIVSLLLALVAMIASYIPARRATAVDPMIALRHE